MDAFTKRSKGQLKRKRINMGDLSGFVRERVASLVSKKVGASAIGVSLIAGDAPEAGWAAIAYAAIQGVVDAVKAIAESKKA
jgi:hypothetical protein